MIILNPSIDCDFLVFLIYVLGVRLLGYLGSGWFVVTYLHTFLCLWSTDSELLEQFENHPEYSTSFRPFGSLSDNCFDGTWLAAVALNCTVNRLKEMGILAP